MTFAEKPVDYDVIVIGAGISGLCFAYRLQERNPDLSYCILEQRDGIGGTWSLFQYPGLRSDSDLFTFGFPWQPWTGKDSIAKGDAIKCYMEKAASDANIHSKIKFNRKVNGLSWNSEEKRWTVDSTVNQAVGETLRTRFIMLATGYYDYDEPLRARIPGIESFTGAVVHPQFWPKDLDYRGKNGVIIGSGATAITLLPAMASEANHITMLQRSPSYIMSMPMESRFESVARAWLPTRLATKLIRMKWILCPAVFRKACILFPNAARKLMKKTTLSQLGEDASIDPDFNPTYNPFEQRMCMCPDGDFYECLRNGSGSVKTGRIDTVTADSIVLTSGEELRPDFIVTATGLKLRLGGGIQLSVDGEPFRIPDHYVWKGLMVEDLPNLAFSFGYIDASWTLGVDISAQMACRLLKQMGKEKAGVIVPRRGEEDRTDMNDLQFMPLTSTYVEKARSALPRVGDRSQWRPRASYLWERITVGFSDIKTGLEWTKDTKR